MNKKYIMGVDPAGSGKDFSASITYRLGKGVCEVVSTKHTPEGKNKYPIIDIPASGKRGWGGGAYTLAFVYSKYSGNFILRGYYCEVKEYLKKNYTHYFVNFSLWSEGVSRNIWDWWNDDVTIFTPSKLTRRKDKRDYKYNVVKYGWLGDYASRQRVLTLPFKRLPKRWIPLFDQF